MGCGAAGVRPLIHGLYYSCCLVTQMLALVAPFTLEDLSPRVPVKHIQSTQPQKQAAPSFCTKHCTRTLKYVHANIQGKNMMYIFFLNPSGV